MRGKGAVTRQKKYRTASCRCT